MNECISPVQSPVSGTHAHSLPDADGNKFVGNAVAPGVKVKEVLRKKFSWKSFPELEAYLIDNRNQYLEYSNQLNYTKAQKLYNNNLTQGLLDLAAKEGYIFEGFTFPAVRDRIRCFYKSKLCTHSAKLEVSVYLPQPTDSLLFTISLFCRFRAGCQKEEAIEAAEASLQRRCSRRCLLVLSNKTYTQDLQKKRFWTECNCTLTASSGLAINFAQVSDNIMVPRS